MDKKNIETKARLQVENILIDPIVAGYMHRLKLHHKSSFQHSLNVAYIASQIILNMNIDKKEREIIIRGALLHDIGKLSIPKYILDKKEPLSEYEVSLILKHPEVGYQIVSEKVDNRVSNIVLLHHERLDGSGYPNNESDLPFEVRIVSVVDSYDAMTEYRSYKDILTYDQTMRELIKNELYDMFVIHQIEKISNK